MEDVSIFLCCSALQINNFKKWTEGTQMNVDLRSPQHTPVTTVHPPRRARWLSGEPQLQAQGHTHHRAGCKLPTVSGPAGGPKEPGRAPIGGGQGCPFLGVGGSRGPPRGAAAHSWHLPGQLPALRAPPLQPLSSRAAPCVTLAAAPRGCDVASPGGTHGGTAGTVSVHGCGAPGVAPASYTPTRGVARDPQTAHRAAARDSAGRGHCWLS